MNPGQGSRAVAADIEPNLNRNGLEVTEVRTGMYIERRFGLNWYRGKLRKRRRDLWVVSCALNDSSALFAWAVVERALALWSG